MMAKLQAVATRTAGAASGALSNRSSRDKGTAVSTPLAEPVAPSSTSTPGQPKPKSTTEDVKGADQPVVPSAEWSPSPIPSEGGLRSALVGVKSRVPAGLMDIALGEAKRHAKNLIISKLALVGVVGVVVVAGVVLIVRQVKSKPASTVADRVTAALPAPSVNSVNPPTKAPNDTAALLAAKLFAAEQCMASGDLACATSAADQVLRLEPQNIAAIGMKRRLAIQTQEQAKARAPAETEASALATAPVPVQTQVQTQVPALLPSAILTAPSATISIPIGGAMAQDPRSGCRVWKPSLVPNDAVTWSGQCVGGLAEGPGIAQWTADGKSTLTYEGTFRSGMLQGRGRMIAAGGDRYEGDYRDGKREGRGAYIAGTGERYDGEFKDNRRDGQGVITRADGTRVEGMFKDGKPLSLSPSPSLLAR